VISRAPGERTPASRFTLAAVIELMRFRLPPDGDEAAFLAADRNVQDEFGNRQPGLLGRTTARGEDGGWIVITRWRCGADADAADGRGASDELIKAFMALVDRSTISIERYQELL
jgi:hypothetical protein